MAAALPHGPPTERADVRSSLRRQRWISNRKIEGSWTDIIMLFMNDRALQSFLSDKFKLGGDAGVAAGSVGRHAAAGKVAGPRSERPSFTRSARQ